MSLSGYIEFEFNLPRALLSQLVSAFENARSSQLENSSIDQIPEAQGVYQLFLDNELTYIGKTDAEAGLRKRLGRHFSKIRHRVGLDPSRVSFKAARIFVFTAIDLETQLIGHYGGVKKVKWNGSGFGSNDPGRNRDDTVFKEEHFDSIYPIDIDREMEIEFPINAKAAEILTSLKTMLPYVFRHELALGTARTPHSDLVNTTITLDDLSNKTTRGILRGIAEQLPPGWQATKLPSHVILYKEARHYKQGDLIYGAND